MSKKPIIVFIGTYPPRECGIATFNQDLLHSSRLFLGPHISCRVAALNHSQLDTYAYPPEVAWQINQDNGGEYLDFAREINANVLVAGVTIQHEYGIYGGEEGENILDFMKLCQKPILTTLHTVLPTPNAKMKEVTAGIIRRSNIIVVLTQKSRKLLEKIYPFAEGKVYVVPHGIHEVDFTNTLGAKRKLKLENATILTTFGLLSRGKGIEYVLRALPPVVKQNPLVKYLILGKTHPTVRRLEGEKYRLELESIVSELGLNQHVRFYDQYLDLPRLLAFLQATDIYLSTSINPNQAVSGTLSYAMGSGRAIISTKFSQSEEIVTPETGRLVPILDSPAYTRALLDLLKDDKVLRQMHAKAYNLTRTMLWSNVAREYSELLAHVVLPPIKLLHLHHMTDDFGLFQFSHLDEPDKKFGYTLDDNARALVACNRLIKSTKNYRGIENLMKIYLRLIEYCQQSDGSFINYLGYPDNIPTDQNNQEDTADAYGRAIWACAEVYVNQKMNPDSRKQAERILNKALVHIDIIDHLRTKAYVIKALILLNQPRPDLAIDLVRAYQNCSDNEWHWFEDHLGYNNAIIPESLILAGQSFGDQKFTDVGLESLQFLIDESFSTNRYLPIGQAQWYKKGDKRSYFDQQPEDPASMIAALYAAHAYTKYDSYRNLANKCFSWFLGNNSLHKPLYNYQTGGCFDGLHPNRVNLNQGAESLVSYLNSRLLIAELNSK